MDSDLVFTLDAVRKIVIFAYETGYCDGIEDKYPEWKDYKNAEEFWSKNKDEYIERFAIKDSK